MRKYQMRTLDDSLAMSLDASSAIDASGAEGVLDVEGVLSDQDEPDGAEVLLPPH